MRKLFPPSVYNPLTFVGTGVASISLGLILFLMVLESFSKVHKPYMGIVAFVILPMFLVLGILIAIFGMLREQKRRQQVKYKAIRFPSIDLNQPKQRRAFLFITIGTFFFLVLSAFGSFKAYEYTDSDEFCGTVCHKVMNPEYTAYQSSPHSKVGCVKCHIGEGAGWFVRAKISGSYQLYSVMFNKYSRPIPTPIENLRPAGETCEQCHWPRHFYSEKKISLDYFSRDESNSKSHLTMLLKVGGGNTETGITTGIHWHMNIANDIYYMPTDESRQQINWVKMKPKNGSKEVIYRLKDEKNKSFMPEEKHIRKMDCIDCHNRPSHQYNEPNRMVNLKLTVGQIDSTLPFVKSVSVQALEGQYVSNDDAMQKITSVIKDFYITNYPEIASKKLEQINKTIDAVQKIYSRNYFPEMKVSWKYYPNNIGHMNYDGCFRCHDGKHVSDDGRVIQNDCNSCHLLLAQNLPGKEKSVSMDGVKYIHPGDISISLATQKCSECHGVKKSEKIEKKEVAHK